MTPNSSHIPFMHRFGARNAALVEATAVDFINILTFPLSPFITVILTTVELVTPLAVPSGKRHMTHFTEAAIFSHKPNLDEAVIHALGTTFCSSSDDFDLVVGERTAFTRVLEASRKNHKNYPPLTKDGRGWAWEKYREARRADDDKTFEAVIQAARAQKKAEEDLAWKARQSQLIAEQQVLQAQKEALNDLFGYSTIFESYKQQSLADRQLQTTPFPPRMRPQLEQNLGAGLAGRFTGYR